MSEKGTLIKNLPNIVTILGLVGAIWLLVITITSPEQLGLIFVLAIIVSSTDYLDGWLAKRLEGKSDVGAALDRLRDKVFIVPTLIILTWYYKDKVTDLPITGTLTEALVIVVVLIEALLFFTGLIGLFKKLGVESNPFGKKKMFFEFLVVIIWLASLTIEKYLGKIVPFSIYLIDLCLLLAAYYSVKSFEGYYQRYTTKAPEK